MFGYAGVNQPVTVSYDDTPERKALREAQMAARNQAGRAIRICERDRAGQHIADGLEWLAAPGWQGDIAMLRAFTDSIRRLLDWAEAGKDMQAGEAA